MWKQQYNEQQTSHHPLPSLNKEIKTQIKNALTQKKIRKKKKKHNHKNPPLKPPGLNTSRCLSFTNWNTCFLLWSSRGIWVAAAPQGVAEHACSFGVLWHIEPQTPRTNQILGCRRETWSAKYRGGLGGASSLTPTTDQGCPTSPSEEKKVTYFFLRLLYFFHVFNILFGFFQEESVACTKMCLGGSDFSWRERVTSFTFYFSIFLDVCSVKKVSKVFKFLLFLSSSFLVSQFSM